MKSLRIITVLTFFLSFISCKKEKLTKETQVGANTFSCKINDVVHIPNNEAFGSKAISASLNRNENAEFYDLDILTNYSRNNPFEKIYLTLFKINQVGVYKLNGGEFRYGTYILGIANGLGGITYNSKAFNKGEVNITKLDLVNKIISGTFWFEATNLNDPNDKVSVTDGRFDLKI
ncbi:MAG: hypothetical protein H7195_10300 [Chryseobacterium sp.]|nr:hypothetical protein [Chryseobacterium sp.]